MRGRTGQAAQRAALLEADGYGRAARQIDDLLQAPARRAFGNQDTIERAARLEALEYGVDAAEYGHSALLFGQQIQPIVEPVGEVGYRRNQRDLDDLFVVVVLAKRIPGLCAVRRAGQFARICDRGALRRAESVVLAGLEGAHFVFRDSRLATRRRVRGGAIGAFIGVGHRQVNEFLGALLHGSRTYDGAVEWHEVLQHLGPVGHQTEEVNGTVRAFFEVGQEFILRRIDELDSSSHPSSV